jgi:nicotinamidase-related amidase
MKFDAKTTVVLSCDLQHGILEMNAGSETAVAAAARVLSQARERGLPIVHVRVGFQEGYPEISSRNKRFSQIRQSGKMRLGTRDTEIHPELYREGETVVTKVRIGAFAGSTLKNVLSAHNAQTLVIFGVATSGVVLTTLREASDLDYEIVVVSDACFDKDEEVHRVLTAKVFPAQATMVTADELLR